MIICRCEEVTEEEILKAIKQGAIDVNGVKRRTRAGMGLCQGSICEKLVQQILKKELGFSAEEISFLTRRPPIRPITFGVLGNSEQD